MFKEKLLREALRRYAGEEVLERVLRMGESAFDLAGSHEDMTILCAEPYSMEEPKDGVAQARARIDCWSMIIDEVERHQGVVDSYFGDAIIARFHADSGVNRDRAAIQCAAAIAQAGARAENGPPLFIPRMGIDTGNVFLGNIGTPERLAFTLRGDAVNRAYQCAVGAAHHKVSVLLTGEVLKGAEFDESAGPCRLVDTVELYGKRVAVFTLK